MRAAVRVHSSEWQRKAVGLGGIYGLGEPGGDIPGIQGDRDEGC